MFLFFQFFYIFCIIIIKSGFGEDDNMNYFETDEYEIQKTQMIQLLSDFYYATGIPVMLLSRSASTLVSVPEGKQLIASSHSIFRQEREWDSTQEIVSENTTCIISPITAVQGLFGFLYVELPSDANRNAVNGIIRFLELTQNEISQNNLILLQYQRYVDQFKASIWDFLDADLSVSSLCQLMSVGKTKLSSDFKKYAGTTIAKFILNVRLEKAQQLLSATDLTITEIAEKVGFNDYNYFCRVFKKSFDMSPQRYRISQTILSASEK